jgi:CRP/FNR family transcriptional regulator
MRSNTTSSSARLSAPAAARAAQVPAPAFRHLPFLKETSATAVRLTARQREQLMQIGVRLRLPARTIIYRERDSSDAVFVVMDGVVKCYRDLRSGKRVLCAFLFSRDLFGLAHDDRYVNTAQAATDVVLYRLPLQALTALLKQDGDLQFQFLQKILHELRESQRRAILVGRRDAPGRLAMFLASMAARQGVSPVRDARMTLPMTRTDIADYIGLSLESVSRAAAQLERKGIARFEGRHHAWILDRGGLARLAAAV